MKKWLERGIYVASFLFWGFVFSRGAAYFVKITHPSNKLVYNVKCYSGDRLIYEKRLVGVHIEPGWGVGYDPDRDYWRVELSGTCVKTPVETHDEP